MTEAEHEVHLVAHYRLPSSVGVEASCLGLSTATRIGGRECRVLLPTVSFEGGRHYGRAPQVEGLTEAQVKDLRLWRSQLSGPHDDSNARAWTTVVEWEASGAFEACWLHEVVIDFGEVVVSEAVWPYLSPERAGVHLEPGRVSSDELVDPIASGVNAWFAAVTDWVRLVVSQPVDDTLNSASTEIVGNGVHLHAYGPDREGPISKVNRVVVSSGRPAVQALSPAQWALVLRLVANNDCLPDELLLVADARMALLRGQGRLALIQACTSIELLMQQLFETQLSDLDSATRAAVVAEHRTLGRLQEVVKKCGVDLPPRLGEVVTARNAAIHKNSQPLRSTAQTAIAVALSLASQIFELEIDTDDSTVIHFQPQ